MSGRPYEKHKKALLSEALQRANDAVQLDNDADYYRAVVAYNEACNLLNDVVQRSSSADDQRKLTAIRTTYMTRVQELQPLAGRKSRSSSQNTGSRPGTSEARKQKSGIQQLDGTSDAGNRTRAATSRNASGAATTLRFLGSENPTISNAKASEITSGLHGNAWARSALTEQPPSLQSGPQNLPPPLSPRRSPAPQSQWPPSDGEEVSSEPWRESGIVDKRPRPRDSDGSWFNAGGEELASLHLSNHHSVSSLAGLRRRDLRNNQGDTEAEFDAALDAAVEAAYNDGYEPYDDKYMNEGKIHDEREARIRAEKNAAATSRLHQEALHQTQGGSDDGSVVDSDEEERLLDQVTRGFPDEAQSASRQQPSQPRQSDSSGFSNRTYGSSVASSLTTAGTSLSTVDEVLSVPLPNAKPETAKQLPPLPQSSNRPPIPHSPPIIQRPKDAIEGSRDAPQSAWMQSPEMRQRRMSETGKKLKIETAVLPSQAGLDKDLQKDQSMEPLSKVQSANSVSSAKTAPTGRTDDSRLSPLELTAVSAKSTSPSGALQLSSPYPSPFVGSFPPDIMSSSVPLSSTMSNDSKFVESPASDTLISPVYPTGRGLKQSGSTSNLNRLVSEEMDPSPATPMSFSFSSTMSPQLQQDEFERRVGEPNNREDTVPASKIKLFDNEMHFRGYDCPRPLEACPESVLLRPFWLMRCFYQTLSNPKGGYLSTRLFVPHDVWKVKAPKLKAIEDKIATCDYLTAALLKLSTVDPLDADAIHDEMMGFEQLLDETQATLSKKLGSDVGTHNASALFKDAVPGAPPNASESTSTQAGTEGKSASTGSQSGKHGSKSWQSSWRKKLRNKSSNNPVASNYTTLKEGSERTMTMSSLPMQPLEVARSRPIKREISGNNMAVPKIDGPNANYASSVAKLCDAAQVLDQIARQAEDPGLKLSSPAHVGLELSARHSAEFFGFYICRFILQDLMMLMDKFMKRATEWILT
ncbi:MAG: hypothetical protein M1828_007048 [Chrysothrix sp. TS-e1954]|nr:MAG: hypothetical protein M1828_007048 [Chrysothrix sp. TS-e1954]